MIQRCVKDLDNGMRKNLYNLIMAAVTLVSGKNILYLDERSQTVVYGVVRSVKAASLLMWFSRVHAVFSYLSQKI